METNVVEDLGTGIANALGDALANGLSAAQDAIEGSQTVSEAQSILGAILLTFVGIAALFYVGRWLYKAFKRGAA